MLCQSPRGQGDQSQLDPARGRRFGPVEQALRAPDRQVDPARRVARRARARPCHPARTIRSPVRAGCRHRLPGVADGELHHGHRARRLGRPGTSRVNVEFLAAARGSRASDDSLDHRPNRAYLTRWLNNEADTACRTISSQHVRSACPSHHRCGFCHGAKQ